MKKIKYKIDDNNSIIYPLAVYRKTNWMGIPFWKKIQPCDSEVYGLAIIDREVEKAKTFGCVPIYREFVIED